MIRYYNDEFPLSQQFALQLISSHINLRHLPGEILHCVLVEATDYRSGDMVIVERTKQDGSIEAAAWRYERKSGEISFHAESSDPLWQNYSFGLEDAGVSAKIIGVVEHSIKKAKQ